MKKGEFIVRIGEVLNEIYFLENGITRGYLLDVNGKDVTDCFSFCCGAPVMPFCQMELNIPSPLTLEVLENSVFFYIPISAVSELQEKYQEIGNTLYEGWKQEADIQVNSDVISRIK